MKIPLSDDGKEFRTVATLSSDVPQNKGGLIIKEFSHVLSGEKARFIRIYAKNIGVCPDWHPAAGEPFWIFVDEIIIK